MFNSTSTDYLISPTHLDQFLDQSLFREKQSLSYDIGLQHCPSCHASIRKTNSRERKVDHLNKQIIYEIAYYYCDTCHQGWPSLPPCVLPNLTCGIDVLGHLAYWHVLKQQSFQTLMVHLQDCHGINRSERTIQRYLERFAILIEDTQSVFTTLVQAYLKGLKKTQGLYDEAFFSSRYPEKLCLSLLLLPEVRVIAGIKVTEKRNQELITEIMSHFQQLFGELDVVATDLSPLYLKAVGHAYTSATLQFCVFHFFQLLERNLVKPLAHRLMDRWKERLKKQKKTIRAWYKRVEKSLSGKYQDFLLRITDRVYWCLARRRPDKVQVEVQSFCQELQFLDKKHHHLKVSLERETQDRKKLILGIEQLIDVLKKWDRYMRSDRDLKTFQELQQQIFKVQQVFQESDEQRFDQDYQAIMNECLDSSEQVLQELGKYLKKYQEELSVYLEWGLEKTTSLLEQVFQRLKKTTSHNRGGKDKESLELFVRLYQFFWNVEPIRLQGERTADRRSPLARLQERTELPIPLDLTQRWWYWLFPMSYQDYRTRVREFIKQRRLEWQHLQESRGPKQPSHLKTLKERATHRWKNSKTLHLLDDLLSDKPLLEKKRSFNEKKYKKLGTTTHQLYDVLRRYPRGLSRKQLVKLLKLPRSTIYDNLVLLGNIGLVTTKKVKKRQAGRPVTLFLARPLPER